jgi:hypothetical protein
MMCSCEEPLSIYGDMVAFNLIRGFQFVHGCFGAWGMED